MGVARPGFGHRSGRTRQSAALLDRLRGDLPRKHEMRKFQNRNDKFQI
jgi:hypothetical protein